MDKMFSLVNNYGEWTLVQPYGGIPLSDTKEGPDTQNCWDGHGGQSAHRKINTDPKRLHPLRFHLDSIFEMTEP